MKENFITEIATTWGENISEYFSLLQQHPIRLVSLILDLTIVIYIIVKILKLAKIKSNTTYKRNCILYINNLDKWIAKLKYSTLCINGLLAIWSYSISCDIPART